MSPFLFLDWGLLKTRLETWNVLRVGPKKIRSQRIGHFTRVDLCNTIQVPPSLFPGACTLRQVSRTGIVRLGL